MSKKKKKKKTDNSLKKKMQEEKCDAWKGQYLDIQHLYNNLRLS